MRSLRLVLVALALGLVPSLVSAQTYRLSWDQPLAVGHTFTDVGNYLWTLKVGSANATAVAPSCVNGTPVKCSVPLPTIAGGSGPTPITITAATAFGSASGSISGTPPAGMVNITVTVVVQIP